MRKSYDTTTNEDTADLASNDSLDFCVFYQERFHNVKSRIDDDNMYMYNADAIDKQAQLSICATARDV